MVLSARSERGQRPWFPDASFGLRAYGTAEFLWPEAGLAGHVFAMGWAILRRRAYAQRATVDFDHRVCFLPCLIWGQSSACDLTGDGSVNSADVTAAKNMVLNLAPCTANVYGSGVCNVVVVQRVINASSGRILCDRHRCKLTT